MIEVTFKRRAAGGIAAACLALACSSEGEMTPAISAGAGSEASGTSGTRAAAAGASPAAGSGTAGSVATAGASGVAAAGRGGTAGSANPAAGAAAGAGAAGVPATPSPAAGSGGSPTAGASGGAGGMAGSGSGTATERFSFFVTSWAAMQRLSKSPDGFGGDLRYGQPDGLSGADKICTEIAETAMPGSGSKGWRAFLSVTKGPDGQPVHAIDRVGEGPWYDRLGRLIAMNKADLANQRPRGADAMIINDLPNEDGVPNHAPDGELVDNHDILTGTNNMGRLFSMDWGFTCHDWTSSVGRDGTPRVGHSWPRMGGGRGGRGGAAGSGGAPFVPPPGGAAGRGGLGDFDTANWMSALNEAGCAAGASLVEMGPPNPEIPTVGSGGGYGGIYCFALKP